VIVLAGFTEQKAKFTKRKAILNSTAKVTAKGQVTIPAAVRKALSVNEGDELIFEVSDGMAEIRKLTAIDRLSKAIGPRLREAFPTPKDFDAYLKANRKKIFESIYGEINDKSGD
jgi:AbrB family looped-hinge helix DNA binding protein